MCENSAFLLLIKDQHLSDRSPLHTLSTAKLTSLRSQSNKQGIKQASKITKKGTNKEKETNQTRKQTDRRKSKGNADKRTNEHPKNQTHRQKNQPKEPINKQSRSSFHQP